MSNPVITKFLNYQHFVPYWGFFIPNNKTSSAADTFFLVSIPTRGLLIPNRRKRKNHTHNKGVSVPTRGLLIPNINYDDATSANTVFPSPQGVS